LLDGAVEHLAGLAVEVGRFNLANGANYRVRLRLAVDAELAPRPPIANLIVRIPTRWAEELPKVWTDDVWAYRDVDWHTSPVGPCSLCWALPNEWQDWIGFWQREGVHPDIIRERARDWIITSCELLMRRHYLGRVLSLETWPDDWDAHEHFERGVARFKISGSVPYRIYRKSLKNEYPNAVPRSAA